MAPAKSPPFRTLRLSSEGRVARLALARPEIRNALDYAGLRELIDAAAWLDSETEAEVVVVSGDGPSFCGGFNVVQPGALPGDGSPATSIDFRRLAMNAVAGMRALTVARVQGHARGGGFVLALACDLRVVAADARLSLPESQLRMTVPWGAVPRLVRELGPMLTKLLVLSGREMTGDQIASIGVATELVPAAALDEAVDALVRDLLRSPRRVIELLKQQVELFSEGVASTADGADDVRRFMTTLADPECHAARQRYLTQWGAKTQE